MNVHQYRLVMNRSYVLNDNSESRISRANEVFLQAQAAGLVDAVHHSGRGVHLRTGTVEICLPLDEAIATLERALLLRLSHQLDTDGSRARSA